MAHKQPHKPDGIGARRRLARAARAALSVVCAAALLTCTGCRDSDALVEVIYDQTADIIDYDNEEKYYINDPESDEESDKVSSDEAAAVNKITDLMQNIVVYSSEPNSTYVAKKSVWAEDPDFTGIEASETVTFYISDDEDVEHVLAQEIEDDEEDEEEDDDVSAAATSDEGTTGETGSGGAGDSEDEGELASESADESTAEAETGEGGGESAASGEGITIVDSTDDLAELPSVDYIAAFGQYAVIVQMIGGEGALVAADYELLSEDGFQTVFADEGASDIVQGWSDDGESASTIDVDAIIESGAQTVLVTSSEYEDDISESDQQKLVDAGISFTIMASLTNSTGIKRTVTAVGKLLKDSTVIGNAGKTVSLAKEYKQFHNELVKACMSANGGGLASYNDRIFETGNNESYSYNDSASWTLLIDAWDTSVSHNNENISMNGIGLTNIGYATTPVSFYIQAGGLVNSSAAKAGNTYSGLYAVWQFSNKSTSKYICFKTYFVYETGGLFDESVTFSKRKSFAEDNYGDVFLCAAAGSDAGITNGLGGAAPAGFGSDSFPKVIAATQQIKEYFVENVMDENGAYHFYDLQTNGVMSYYYGPANTDAWGCVGSPGSSDGNVLSGSTQSDIEAIVCVNPHGLFASWTEYGSAEAVLEAAWVNDVVNDDSSDVGWEDYVKEFYSTFYRYDLSSSELATIEAGLEK